MQSSNAKDKKIWNDIFSDESYDWRSIPASIHMKDCLQFFTNNQVQTVLDVGCGPGVWSIFLASNGFKVIATDFSASAIAYGRQWAEQAGLSIDFRVAPLNEQLDIAGVDGIVASKILDNVTQVEMNEAVELFAEYLPPSGSIYGLFNPTATQQDLATVSDNPTVDCTNIPYTDDQLLSAFENFTIESLKTYEDGLRGLFLTTGE